MKGATMLATMQRLGVVPSFSRPSVSNDNPFSESLFRTMKYVPAYPRDGFVAVEAARVWVAAFVAWYNHEHKHSGIGFVGARRPSRWPRRRDPRRTPHVYEQARRRNPSRWSRHTRLWSRPDTVTLNPEADHAVANTDRLAA
jgi:putative transposase